MSPSRGGEPFKLHRIFCSQIAVSFSVTAIGQRFLQKRTKRLAELGKIDPILRPLRTGHARLHVAEIQFEIDAVIDLAFARHAEHFLRAEIIFERGALLVGAAGRAQIIDRFVIDREKAHRRAVFRRHVADRRAIRHRQRGRAFAVKLDKFADDFLRAQHLRDVQDEIGRGHAFAQVLRSDARRRLPGVRK